MTILLKVWLADILILLNRASATIIITSLAIICIVIVAFRLGSLVLLGFSSSIFCFCIAHDCWEMTAAGVNEPIRDLICSIIRQVVGMKE